MWPAESWALWLWLILASGELGKGSEEEKGLRSGYLFPRFLSWRSYLKGLWIWTKGNCSFQSNLFYKTFLPSSGSFFPSSLRVVNTSNAPCPMFLQHSVVPLYPTTLFKGVPLEIKPSQIVLIWYRERVKRIQMWQMLTGDRFMGVSYTIPSFWNYLNYLKDLSFKIYFFI